MPRNDAITKPSREQRRKLKRHEGRGPSGWNQSSKLWFGKHAGEEIWQIPRDYLQGLVKSMKNQPAVSSRIERLVQFLRTYLKSENRPQSGLGEADLQIAVEAAPAIPNPIQPGNGSDAEYPGGGRRNPV